MAKRQTPPGRKRVTPGRAVRRRRPATRRVAARAGSITLAEVKELNALRRELERAGRGRSPLRWNAAPDDVQRSVAQLVLTLVEFIRRLLERQAIRRMKAGTLADAQVESVGRALMQLEKTVQDMAAAFGIPPEDLNLDLGPAGKLM